MVTFGKVGKGKLTPKDRQRISRNLIGGATMLAAYQYRSSEDAPPDFKKLRLDDNTEMDTTPQFPMRQFLYLGEAGRRLVEGTFEDFFDSKEFLETFVGTNLRTGVGESIFQDLADIISATDISSEEKAAKGLVAPVADYLASWFVPFAQIIETQRALGIRGLEYKDLREDPTLDALTTAKKEFEKPFKQRGFTVSPEEEEAAPKREFVFAEDKKRVSPISRVLLGLNLSTRDSEEGEYLARLGYKDFKFGSKSQVPTVQRAENKIIREALPLIVNFVRDEEDNLREEYRDAGPATKNDFTEQAYVNSGVKGLIDIQIRKLKEKIANEGLGKGQASEYARQLLSFRKLPKNIRRRAVTQFYDLNGKPPNVAEEDDLTELAIIGKKIKSIFRGN
jgi:hypothetical protein